MAEGFGAILPGRQREKLSGFLYRKLYGVRLALLRDLPLQTPGLVGTGAGARSQQQQQQQQQQQAPQRSPSSPQTAGGVGGTSGGIQP
jgi:hypothetical protein